MTRDREPFLTLEQLGKLWRCCGPRERALFLLMYELALRASEPGRLRWNDWTEDGVRVSRGKGSKSGTWPVSAPLSEALRIWRNQSPGHGTPMFPGYRGRGLGKRMVYTLFARAAKAAGLSGRAAYPHILKHSRLTHLADELVTQDPRAADLYLQHAAGHVSPLSTRRYLHLTERQRKLGDATSARIIGRITGQVPTSRRARS